MPFYEWSMKLWEGLEQDLNYNAMVSQRGVLNLYHSDAQRDAYRPARQCHAAARRRCRAARPRRRCARMVPFLDFDNARFPIQGGLLQRRGGTARHDAVAWGYARAADRRGVDIIQNCEVTGFRIEDGRVVGVETTRGLHPAPARSASRSPATPRASRRMAGLRLPIESHVLQAFVSEGVKPLIDSVVTFGAGHFYISQSDKGGLVFGGDIDGYNSYAQRGNLPVVEDVMRRRHGADAGARPRARAAPLGRHHGHVDGRLADHRPDAGRRPLSQCRLVLWRLQGDAGLGLVLRPSDRHGTSRIPSPPPIGSTASRPARVIDEKGAGAQPNLH